MNNTLPALIIGAGPCGLAAAAFLTHYHIPCRIIDKKAGPTQTSNAVGLHARTLELLEELNLSQQFLAAGRLINQGRFFVDRKELGGINFNTIPSIYNFICDVPQNHTEQIFLDYLQQHNITVEYNSIAHTITQNQDITNVIVTTIDGSDEIINANWVIAADGYNSTVRELCPIAYSGKEFAFHFLMMDAVVESQHINDNFMIGITNTLTCMIFPMQTSARIIMEITKTDQYTHTEPTVELFNQMLQETFPFHLNITKNLWASKFYVHERLAENYRFGSIFLIGDAAHVHIPAAAQGMNTGIQDAINLTWKLAQVINHQANSTILSTYQEERRPIAKQVLAMTEIMGKTLLSRNPWLKLLRRLIFSYILKISSLQKRMTTKLAELHVNYSFSRLSQGSSLGQLTPGDRFSAMPIPALNGQYLILDFSGELSTIPFNSIPANIYRISTIEKNTYFPNIHKGYCVIRPDRYIGCATTSIQILQDYLTKFNNNSE